MIKSDVYVRNLLSMHSDDIWNDLELHFFLENNVSQAWIFDDIWEDWEMQNLFLKTMTLEHELWW